MKLKIDNVESVLEKSLEDACGLTAYKETLNLDAIATEKYQRNFTSYYKIRRDRNWLKKFYEYMNQLKNKSTGEVSFESILLELSSWKHNSRKTRDNPTGVSCSIEVSFASKLFATLCPENPIWDSQVVEALKIKVHKRIDRNEMIQEYIAAYKHLKSIVSEYLKSNEGKKAIKLFDKQFPNYTWISNYKKIDFFLWNIGKNNIK